MKDAMQSIKAYLYDRSASPLLGAYVLAWSVWNYRVIVILLSSQLSPGQKFLMIEERFSNCLVPLLGWDWSAAAGLLHGLVVPAVITVAYIYAYPLLAKPVYQHSLDKKTELREIKIKIQKATLLTVGESKEIMAENAILTSKNREEAVKFSKQIDALVAENDDLKNREDPRLKEIIDQLTAMEGEKTSLQKTFERDIEELKRAKEKVDLKYTRLLSKSEDQRQKLEAIEEDIEAQAIPPRSPIMDSADFQKKIKQLEPGQSVTVRDLVGSKKWDSWSEADRISASQALASTLKKTGLSDISTVKNENGVYHFIRLPD
jgi:transcription elongation GreA/GreB family factor